MEINKYILQNIKTAVKLIKNLPAMQEPQEAWVQSLGQPECRFNAIRAPSTTPHAA